MNERDYQYRLDFLTGFPTAISDDSCSGGVRSACSALNAGRTQGIKEVSQHSTSGEQVSAHVWASSLTRGLKSWEVPLVSLEKLGLRYDDDGILISDFLKPLPSGAEAAPYSDEKNGVVYKLFDLRANGSLGKKLIFERDAEGEYVVELDDANLFDTLIKLSVLNEAGAHPTEVVGLSEGGDYLIAKQPLAYPLVDFYGDREIALREMRAAVPIVSDFRQTIALTWLNDRAWLVGDLHERNIMRDANGMPTIIDALIGTIPPLVLKEKPFVHVARANAKVYRETGSLPEYKAFDDVDDQDL